VNLFYISDLHISGPDNKVGKTLCSFLSTIQAPDILVLGGDIFDLFVGNKRIFKAKFSAVIAELEGCAGRGVTVYYLEGNHDFHMADVFAGKARINVRADSFPLELHGKKIWVAHGDRIDPKDAGYHFLRWITRTAFVRWLVNVFPDSWLEALGEWMSKTSRGYNNSEVISEERKRRLNEMYLAYAREQIENGYQFVLVGHSHIKAKLPVVVGNKRGEYLNLGFSKEALLVGVWGPGAETFEVQEIKNH